MDTIELLCVKCNKKVTTPRCDVDPPNAILLTGIECPDCDSGGFDMPVYYDVNGNEISGDLETFKE